MTCICLKEQTAKSHMKNMFSFNVITREVFLTKQNKFMSSFSKRRPDFKHCLFLSKGQIIALFSYSSWTPHIPRCLNRGSLNDNKGLKNPICHLKINN